MSGSVNKVILIGNLGADPEIRAMGSGDRIANLRVATSETWRDKSTGERKERTEWHRVVVFNDNLVKLVESYCRKGSKLYVEGSIQTRKWTDTSGVEKFSTEIVLQKFRGELVLLDGRSEGGGGNHEAETSRGSGREQPSRREDFSADLDDSIPFNSWGRW